MSCHYICIIYKIKKSFHPSYQSNVCFARLPFCFIDINRTSRFDLYNKQKHCKLGVFSRFICLRHFKTHTWNYTFSPRIARILMCCYCVHVHQWLVLNSLTVYSILSANDVMVATFLKSIKLKHSYVPF